ncbi:tRNA (cytidine/uridine-2'-O-)-methyltransferase TrmJ [Shewanella sp. NFH-SH190041]|uniref:tRNA/rRNA methyltransferase n=1 Tax=Shewanella sp. NFH-SH190041 TaxID=2950245 RepID=UPI0021C4A2D0|nr:tRNA/rRNA methyltransferase [Shewanella sp. NFH-SH190041]BDM64341.1 tRNA (cytidine/uridine-2'-O-)-methyltransferase TrmJ [Shewanella sp. NFH-SH190041]
MSLSFILVEPARAANVGAAARAIKTMGFDELILVNSEQHLADEAAWVAHGAGDILANIRVVSTLADLRSEFDLIIGSTARERGRPRTYLSPDELKQHLLGYQGGKIALVFGRESSGLSNDELELCDLYTYVPLAQDYPSLNLAQAVMVYSYALSDVKHQIGLQQDAAPDAQLQALKHKAEQLLSRLEIQQGDKLGPWLLDGVSQLQERDCKLAHQLLSDLLKKLS